MWLGLVSLAVSIIGLAHFNVLNRVLGHHVSRDPIPVALNFIASTAILCVGIVVHLSLGQDYPFSWLAALGGVTWAVPACFLMYIVEALGVCLGPMLWTISTLVFGWCFAYFGVLIEAEHVPRPLLNYLGLGVAIGSFFVWFLVRTEVSDAKELVLVDELELAPPPPPPKGGSQRQKKVVAVILAIVSGSFYGFNTLPIVYASNHSNHSQIAYAFSHFCGIFGANLVFLAVASIWRRNRLHVPQGIFLHGFLLGLTFGVSQVAVFQANQSLSVIIALPIVIMGPNLVTAVYSLFFFQEIRGFKNYLFLIGGFSVTSIGVVLIALSKI